MLGAVSADPRKKLAPPRGFSAVPFLGDLVVLTRLVRDRHATFGLKTMAALTLLYVVSPVDALPEMLVPFIGWVDDVGLVLALRMMIEPKLAKYRYPLFELPPAPEPPAVAPAAVAGGKRPDQFASG